MTGSGALRKVSSKYMISENGFSALLGHSSLLRLLDLCSKEGSVARKRFLWLMAVVRLFSTAIMSLCLVYTIWTVGPFVETKFFPVVNKLMISDVKLGPVDGTTQFTASFLKVRNCEYLGIGWYTDDDERVPVVLQRTVHDDDTPNRPPGFTRTGPWIVYLTHDQLMKHSHALLYHRCHPFWVTTTEFYP